MPTVPFSTTVRVRYVECDMQGHVFNGHYLTWFDMAHTELLREAVGQYTAWVEREGIDIVVAESGVRYLAPAHFDDELVIEVALEEPTTSSLTSRFTIRRDGEAITEGFLRHVCVNHKTYKKAAWPDHVRAAFGAFVVPTPTG